MRESKTQLTLLTKSDGPLSKNIRLNGAGIVSDPSGCGMSRGTAQRIELDSGRALADMIANMRSDQALALGRLRGDLPEAVNVVCRADLSGKNSPNTIARTGEFLGFAPGEPGWMLIDAETKDTPAEIAEKRKQVGGLWKAILAAAPALVDARRVSRASTSAGIYDAKSGERFPGSRGRHDYVLVEDASDIERSLRVLHDRLWLSGFGCYVVGAAGQLLDRSLIDASVYGPERLVFEGAPVLEPPLAQDQEKRRPKVFETEVIDTATALPSLSEDEQRQLQELKAEAADVLKPKAAKVRKSWAKKYARKHGLSQAEAERLVDNAVEAHELEREFELVFDNVKPCTVGDVIANPDQYIEETLADPLEGPAYGRCKAKRYRRADGSLMIQSFAHGGISYRLTHPFPVIRVQPGQRARAIDDAEDALLKAQVPIFVRGQKLRRPITTTKEAAKGRTVDVTSFVELNQHQLSYLLNKEAAVFERFDGRSKKWVAIDPPDKVVEGLLNLKDWRFPEVSGVVNAPTLRPDGSILSTPGYDPKTRLWVNSRVELPAIPDKPTRKDAEEALDWLWDLLVEFPFVSEVDESVALAAALTVGTRGAYDLCPIFMINAHEAGTGKSVLVDLISTLATGRDCPVITASRSSEEMEKRLVSILLEGSTLVSLDNVSHDLDGDLLCQIATQRIIKPRILGKTETPECQWRGTLFATGNNLNAVGDLVRRVLTCNMDAGIERPETRKFKFDPIERVSGNRGRYIAAALTIARAYLAAGCPLRGEITPLGGFGQWSRFVREPLVFLGETDPVESMEEARERDPHGMEAREVLSCWKEAVGDKAVTAIGAADIADKLKQSNPDIHLWPEFRAALIAVAGTPKR